MTASSTSFTEIKNPLVKQKGYKWFAAETPDAEGWFGPHDTIEAAVQECIETVPVKSKSFVGAFVCQGYRPNKATRKTLALEHDYKVESEQAFRVSLPAKLIART